jgi:hypothetical protein
MKNGIIHYRNINNFMVVVKLENNSYTVFESFNVHVFSIGDTVSGYLDQLGIYEILNATTQKYQFVLIQYIGLDEKQALFQANNLSELNDLG